QSGREQRVLEAAGLGGSRTHGADLRSDTLLERIANALRRRDIPSRTLFDHTLQRKNCECHAARFEALKIERRQQTRHTVFTVALPRPLECRILEIAQVFSLHVRLAPPAGSELRRRRSEAGHIHHPPAADENRCGSLGGEEPPEQRRLAPIARQRIEHGRRPLRRSSHPILLALTSLTGSPLSRARSQAAARLPIVAR